MFRQLLHHHELANVIHLLAARVAYYGRKIVVVGIESPIPKRQLLFLPLKSYKSTRFNKDYYVENITVAPKMSVDIKRDLKRI